MKHLQSLSAASLAIIGLASSAHATIIVNDTFQDANRLIPAATYSEQGVDADADNDIESRWFGGGLTATTGHLTGTVGATSSASWTTYFTDTFANSINLANTGDAMQITWVFTPTGVGVGNNSQGFRMAFVQSPSAGRLVADGTPASQIYAGYGIFQSFGTTLGRGNNDNFDLMEWTTPGGANNILSTAAAYTKIGTGAGTLNNTGFVDNTQYTFSFLAQRTATGLQIDTSFTGGSLNGTGGLTNSFLDTTVSSYTFDTFALRPSSGSISATTFDTTLFKVEFLPVPEPTTLGLLLGGAGLAGIALSRRNRRP